MHRFVPPLLLPPLHRQRDPVLVPQPPGLPPFLHRYSIETRKKNLLPSKHLAAKIKMFRQSQNK
jgi:hypothetical protein